ncbi:hypothetical protein HOD38_02715 [archaeon]|jgi:hypothetical protein|nr:hypothetical protein [archaeon]MBT4397154.1 hypothetical protein [archaeon]MBT4441540.1 hypothetical protein [archaeon]
MKKKLLLPLLLVLLAGVITTGLFFSASEEIVGQYVDVTVDGIAVRLYTTDDPRYEEGAPIVVLIKGGYEEKDLYDDLQLHDTIVVTFLFPGVEDDKMGRESEGVYDYRGEDSIEALKYVILYSVGEIEDDDGKKINDVLDYALTSNVGAIGVSNGGNLPVASAALYGDELNGYLDYIIQWETPISSQVAARDLGEIVLEPLELTDSPRRGEFFNPRYLGYGKKSIDVDYFDLTYNENSLFEIFHDGNMDGKYTYEMVDGKPNPDLNGNGELSMDEDFPLDYFPDGEKRYYSLPVTQALLDFGVFKEWPENIATVEEAEDYWKIRESVQLYSAAMNNMPDLKAMFLANVEDHVQSNPHKSHVRQAFDGWNDNGAWIQINPDPEYITEVDAFVRIEELPRNEPNVAPSDWDDIEAYCIPENVDSLKYQQAAVKHMADLVYW